VVAAPGLISDTAPARWIGEATTRTAANAARPKTFIPFISYLPLDHARAVRLCFNRPVATQKDS
jgi:hypothetical protein